MPADRVQPVTYELWKQYRASTAWRGEPKYFKEWLKLRKTRKSIDWNDHYRGNDAIKCATMMIDGFRVVVKVSYDEDINCTDDDSYGSYDDTKDDHYAIDRLCGRVPTYSCRDSRKRYYNMPSHARYKDLRSSWLEKRDPVTNKLLQRCRYSGVNTHTKSEDDVLARENIYRSQEALDGWYNDQWYFLCVHAVAYMGDVELGGDSLGGVDSIEDDYVDDVAFQVAEEAARGARKEFEKIRGTSDTRCELIGEISDAATIYEGNDEGLDGWLGFLYACIAKGEALSLVDAPLCFDEFFDRHPDLKKKTRLYVTSEEDG